MAESIRIISPGMTLAEKVRRTREWMEECLRPQTKTRDESMTSVRAQVQHLIDSCETALAAGVTLPELAEAVGVPLAALAGLLATHD